MTKLNGVYLSEYNNIRKYLKRYAKKGQILDDALDELFKIYLSAQNNKFNLEQIHESTLKDYEHELLEGLPKKEHPLLLRNIILAIVILAVTVIVAFFTSDQYYINKYGYSFCFSQPDKFVWSTDYITSGVHSGNVVLDDFGKVVQDKSFEKLGITFEDFMLYNGAKEGSYNDYHFDIMISSHSVSSDKNSGKIYAPICQNKFGNFISKDESGYIKAMLNGCWYIGSIAAYEFGESGAAYTIHFEAENKDDFAFIHNIDRLVCGDELYVCFEGLYKTAWHYIGADKILKSGKLPFFNLYSPTLKTENNESVEKIRYSLTTSDGMAAAVAYSVYNRKLDGQCLIMGANPVKLSDKVDYVEAWLPLYFDQSGNICTDITYCLKTGEILYETVSAPKQTPLVYERYKGNIDGTHYAVTLMATRDEKNGKFTSVYDLTYSSNTEVFYGNMFDYSKTEYKINTSGDIVITLYHLCDENDAQSGYIESTVIFEHGKY